MDIKIKDLDLRDYIAINVMNQLLEPTDGVSTFKSIARMSYQLADDMLEARNNDVFFG